MSKFADRYRVREGVVTICNGHREFRARRFLAERRATVFGLFGFWWPVTDGEWRTTEEAAQNDIARDAYLRLPLAPPKIFEVEKGG
ncbi:hypothetical protein [Roseovarius sp.]|uniref:hypothetical protein n=1 Tax=Roseovarius sp. TaxID=1486281 RepID=UPI003D116F82